MTLSDYLRSALRHWILILVGGLAAASAGLLVARAQPAQYETRARFVVAPSPEITDGRDIVQTLDALANRRAIVSTFGQVVLSERSFDKAVKGAGLTPAQADATKVSAIVVPEANVVEVFVLGPSPNLIESTLGALATESIDYFESLYKVYSVQALDIPSLKAEQVAPKPVQGAVIAGFLGISLAFLVGLVGDRFRSPRGAKVFARRSSPTPSRPPLPALAETDEEWAQQPPAIGAVPVRFPSGALPCDDESASHQRALVVRPGPDIYADHQPPAAPDLIDPDRWLATLHDVEQDVRAWPHGNPATHGEADDHRRWRLELDDLGRVLRDWAESPRPVREVEPSDPPPPS